MNKGFIFDGNKCVGCGACSAACILENSWAARPRNILTFNSSALNKLPVLNLSLACNHCGNPSCLKGCPSGAYSRDAVTNAILIDESKCIGCSYCLWNCPYDAPKYVPEKGTVEKCNLCIERLKEGEFPACSSGCPTGALVFGETDMNQGNLFPEWIPEKKLNPSLAVKNIAGSIALRIVPEEKFASGEFPEKKENMESPEWSLVLFSFLSLLSVSLVASSLAGGVFPDLRLFLLLIFSAGLTSMFHLGKPLRAWMSIRNMFTSPLSREIILFLAFSMLSACAIYFNNPPLLIISSVSGLILLITIDSVYLFADKSYRIVFHSGQTFLSSLLIISFLSDSVAPFIFISVIKTTFLITGMSYNRFRDEFNGLRYLRLALLVVVDIGIISRRMERDALVTILFLSGELLDRILFYTDFKPLNIKREIYNKIKNSTDEKKRCEQLKNTGIQKRWF